MNKIDETLIGRLLEGACSEIELEGLVKKINSDAVFKKELLQQLHLHAALEQRLSPDYLGEKLYKQISRLDLGGSESMSGRVMPRLSSKPKPHRSFVKIFLPIAALFCFAMVFWQWKDSIFETNEIVEMAEIKVRRLDKIIRTMKKEEGVVYKLGNDEHAEYISENGAKLTLLPSSEFHVVGNQIYLHTGQLLADIKKREGLSPLEFVTGAHKTVITGTKFILNYKERNSKNDYLLQLTEGSIDFVRGGRKTGVEANEFLYLSEVDGVVRRGSLSGQKLNLLDFDTIFSSPNNYNWIPFFWSKWSVGQVNISENKRSLRMTAAPGKTVVLTSEVIKTFAEGIDYDFRLKATLVKGAAEIGLRCYYKGVYSYQDSFVLKRNGSNIKTDIIEFRHGKRKVVQSKDFENPEIPPITLSGKIHHLYYEKGEKANSSNDSAKFIEDVVFELFVTAEENTEAYLNINSVELKR